VRSLKMPQPKSNGAASSAPPTRRPPRKTSDATPRRRARLTSCAGRPTCSCRPRSLASDIINTIEPGENAAVSPSPPAPTPTPQTSLAELQAILARGHAGDDAVLPQLRQVFDEHPELAPFLGDLVKHAEEALLTWIAGRSLTAKEALARQVAELRTRLMATTQSELEKLLV